MIWFPAKVTQRLVAGYNDDYGGVAWRGVQWSAVEWSGMDEKVYGSQFNELHQF
eukprot:COSAG02_NODE_1630_length_11576_cov_21.066045_3_plen_54_part_00